ncbi:MAG: hypothetical protein AAF483_29320 [Planctomycetota bacterium]
MTNPYESPNTDPAAESNAGVEINLAWEILHPLNFVILGSFGFIAFLLQHSSSATTVTILLTCAAAMAGHYAYQEWLRWPIMVPLTALLFCNLFLAAIMISDGHYKLWSLVELPLTIPTGIRWSNPVAVLAFGILVLVFGFVGSLHGIWPKIRTALASSCAIAVWYSMSYLIASSVG